jgi:PadR family transcriptional regulator PadR
VKPQFIPRLARAERMILELLVEHGDLFGLALVNASGGRLSRGGIYVTLGRMEEKGLVTSRQEAPSPGAIGLPRRLYSPTPYARRVLDAWTTAATAFQRGSGLREQPS